MALRFLVDESAGPRLANWLADQGHEVYSVYEQSRGERDEQLIRKANDQSWIIVTSDKDFGELVYRLRRPHKGVVLLRLDDFRSQNRIAVMRRLIDQYKERLEGNFVVVEESRVRFGRP
jgi:predicted nuclease of predicted toxin-antitoxin system